MQIKLIIMLLLYYDTVRSQFDPTVYNFRSNFIYYFEELYKYAREIKSGFSFWC